MSRLRAQHGFTLPEVLVGMLLMLIVMAASLTVLDQFRLMHSRADSKVTLQDDARRASRELARSLRNLAASPDLPGVVERAEPYDLVFRTVDDPRADAGDNTRNLRRVRYCLDAADPDKARLLEQTQRWDTFTAADMPLGTSCPSADWGASRVIAEGLTHRAYEPSRPLWTFDQTAAGQVASVELNLFMNDDPSVRAREVALQTGVFLRNQNRAPTATFTAAAAGFRHILLNGSGSSDPEGQPLEYVWFANNSEVGRGLIFDWDAKTAGTHTIRLEVRDPGGLADRSAVQPVVVE
jgi:prepilin-type N-terminal cleavage/methylation domain-containing protein